MIRKTDRYYVPGVSMQERRTLYNIRSLSSPYYRGDPASAAQKFQVQTAHGQSW